MNLLGKCGAHNNNTVCFSYDLELNVSFQLSLLSSRAPTKRIILLVKCRLLSIYRNGSLVF